MAADERTWRIGEVATATGLTVRTLHHYDQIGLVVSSARTSGGHRLYTSADLMLRRSARYGSTEAGSSRPVTTALTGATSLPTWTRPAPPADRPPSPIDPACIRAARKGLPEPADGDLWPSCRYGWPRHLPDWSTSRSRMRPYWLAGW
jgi:hypothetical protein